jgi:hypothetical protein
MAMMKPLEVPPLGISEGEAEIRFEKLQATLIPLWESIRNLDPQEQGERTAVIVASQSIEFDCKGAEMQSYEERMLFLLRQPRTRMILCDLPEILPTTLDNDMSPVPGVSMIPDLDPAHLVADEVLHRERPTGIDPVSGILP